MHTKYVKIEVYVPESHLEALRTAMAGAGAGRSAGYEAACSWHSVTGSWRALPGSHPFNGVPGQVSVAAEIKLEMRCKAALAGQVVRAISAVHPYEEPVINLIPLLDLPAPL